MRLKCIGCDALARLVYLCAAHSPHTVDVTLFRLGLHVEPADLRARIQAQIDETVGQGYDAVALAYGLCGQATAGLAARDVPLVLPRAHDCITIFLGSRQRYAEEFKACPGTYWYALDYMERLDHVGTVFSLGSAVDTDIGSVYEEYVEKYGKDNADYLMEVMGAWQEHYQRAAFIDMGVGDASTIESRTQEEASRRGWTYERLVGDIILVRRLLEGDWEDDFLVLQPGEQVAMSVGPNVVSAAACESAGT
jgi:hypothetical protein